MVKSRTIGLDTSIQTSRATRDFKVTPEPPAIVTARHPAAMFVVQKHAAKRAGLHWDFRLEHEGVLWSWAVPKGPSLDPADRRMAIRGCKPEPQKIPQRVERSGILPKRGFFGKVNGRGPRQSRTLMPPDAAHQASFTGKSIHGAFAAGRASSASIVAYG